MCLSEVNERVVDESIKHATVWRFEQLRRGSFDAREFMTPIATYVAQCCGAEIDYSRLRWAVLAEAPGSKETQIASSQ